MLQHWEFTSSSWCISWETDMNFLWDWRVMLRRLPNVKLMNKLSLFCHSLQITDNAAETLSTLPLPLSSYLPGATNDHDGPPPLQCHPPEFCQTDCHHWTVGVGRRMVWVRGVIVPMSLSAGFLVFYSTYLKMSATAPPVYFYCQSIAQSHETCWTQQNSETCNDKVHDTSLER